MNKQVHQRLNHQQPQLRQVELKIRDLLRKEGTICAALIDSENIPPREAALLASKVEKAGAKLILVGGSTAIDQLELDEVTNAVKKSVTSPVILFPGNVTGVSPSADAILFTCLMNSDNPYFITEAQALAALAIRKYDLEALPTAYLIVGEGGAAGFIGRARGIPPNKPGLASMYALAAKYFGMRFVYLEAGSGAEGRVQPDMVKAVRKSYDGILLVGGGLKTAEVAKNLAEAGADIIVVGTLLEDGDFDKRLRDICNVISRR